MKHCLYCLLTLFGLCALSVQAQSPSATVVGITPKTTPAAIRQSTFEQVWRTVNEKHFDPTFGGVNWEQVRVRYAPQIAAAKDDAAFYGLLAKMIGELGQSHFHIIPPEEMIHHDDGPRDGETGLRLQIVDQLAVICDVTPASPAAHAGLQPGFVLTRIDQQSVAVLIQKASVGKQSAALKRLMLERQLLARINGASGTATELAYLDARNRSFTVNVARQRVTRELSPAFGNFGPQPIEFEAKRLPSGFGYIRFNIWVMPMMEKLRAALRDLKDTPGIIFDVRDNPGGIGGMASGLSGHLFAKESLLGKMQLRSGYNNFVAFPQTVVYRGALVILTDHGSASTSEIFAAGLQDLGRAVVVGERTAGAALPSIIEKLPTGAMFQYAIGDFKTSKGTLLEGRGVIPNVVAHHTRESLLALRDVQLEAAVAQLHQLQKRVGMATK